MTELLEIVASFELWRKSFFWLLRDIKCDDRLV